MYRVAALLLAGLAGCGVVLAAEGTQLAESAPLQVTLSRKPFWITSGSAMAPLGGWAIVGGGRPGQPRRFLVQGTMFGTRFESYDVTNVQGLSIYQPGLILFRDRFAKMARKGTLEAELALLERFHGALRRHAQEAVANSPLADGPPEVMRTAIDSAAGTLLVRYAFVPREGTPASHLYHHVEVLAFYDLDAHKLVRLHVFPVPLE